MSRWQGPTAALLLATATLGLAACSGDGSGAGATPDAPAGPSAGVGPEGLGAAASTVASTASVRDDDVTDVDELAQTMAAGTTGDPDWIEIFARLRAQSWLAARYPGRYDLAAIYRDDAAEAARANEEESLELGVYLDEPLPGLVSVTKSRELGELVELEVVLEAGPATVRGDGDDRAQGVLPGGTRRGLFMVGRDGPGSRWRIHSVVELHVVDRTTSQEPSS